jgi:hypothetical protein
MAHGRARNFRGIPDIEPWKRAVAARGGKQDFASRAAKTVDVEVTIMRNALILVGFAMTVSIGQVSAADGCGPGCHSTRGGACVVDGWGTGASVWNECPAGARPRPPCPSGYKWRPAMNACFQR